MHLISFPFRCRKNTKVLVIPLLDSRMLNINGLKTVYRAVRRPDNDNIFATLNRMKIYEHMRRMPG